MSAARGNPAAANAALGVMSAHIAALNAGDETRLAQTLHFPHFRLSGTVLKTWDTPEPYFADFRARAGERWVRSAFEDIQVLQASDEKVHLDARIDRFDRNDTRITTFRSLWVITFENDRWAAKFRSSFAPA